MSDLERFTQSAYLKSAALTSQSDLLESDDLAYVRSFTSKERWANSIARMTWKTERFQELHSLVQGFDSKGINFNWHVWASSHGSLLKFLTSQIGMLRVGTVDFLQKSLLEIPIGDGDLGAQRLTIETVSDYVDAKMLGWGNSAIYRAEVENATRQYLHDSRCDTWYCKNGTRIIGAVSGFSEGSNAYLRGDFVIPEFRGLGVYRKLIYHREVELSRKGVRNFAVIADQDTSSSIFQKLGYSKISEITVLARKKSAWISL